MQVTMDEILAVAVLISLPKKRYGDLATQAIMLENLDIGKLKDMIQDFDLHRKMSDDPKEDDEIVALKAELKKVNATVDQLRRANVNQNPNFRSVPMCTNPNCKRQKGHTIENCFSKGGGKEGQYPDHWNFDRKRTQRFNFTVDKQFMMKSAPKGTMDMLPIECSVENLFRASPKSGLKSIAVDSGAARHMLNSPLGTC